MKKKLISSTAILATSFLPTCFSFSRRHNHHLHRVHDGIPSLRGPSSSTSSKRLRSSSDNDNTNDDANDDGNNNDDDNGNNQKRRLTTSQEERRREELRRQTRQSSGFATPGISSALPGARDYEINVEKTQREYFESLGIDADGHHFGRDDDDDEGADEDLEFLLTQLKCHSHGLSHGHGVSHDHGHDQNDIPPELQAQIEKHTAIQTEKGLRHLRMLDLPRASRAFSQVYALKPDAYLWHDGLVKYYLGDFHGAAETLARNAVRYEERFGGEEAASEERIWRYAAELKIVTSLNGGRWAKRESGVPVALRVGDVMRERRRNRRGETMEKEEGCVGEEGGDGQSLFPSLEDEEEEEEEEEMERVSIAKERRKVIRLARELFSASIRRDSATVALARAKLQAICSNNANKPSSSFVAKLSDPKQYKLHSYFYLGLHYDAIGQAEESKRCMKMALKACANSISGNGNDITFLLPVIHMTVRDWYDDDELDLEEEDDDWWDADEIDRGDDRMKGNILNMGKREDEQVMGKSSPTENDSQTNKSMGIAKNVGVPKSDQILESIRESIRDMTVVELRKELKKRKLKVGGLKKVLQERLLNDLKSDAELA